MLAFSAVLFGLAIVVLIVNAFCVDTAGRSQMGDALVIVMILVGCFFFWMEWSFKDLAITKTIDLKQVPVKGRVIFTRTAKFYYTDGKFDSLSVLLPISADSIPIKLE